LPPIYSVYMYNVFLFIYIPTQKVYSQFGNANFSTFLDRIYKHLESVRVHHSFIVGLFRLPSTFQSLNIRNFLF